MQSLLTHAITAVNKILLGKELQIRLAFACLLAKGHLLIEDIPGLGKTTLSHALAKVLGLSYNRVQFTSDLLPSDILGVSIFDKNSGTFLFRPGPVFAQTILADEINRASPKTQSALLEAMEEHQVSADGETRQLPDPFFVVATQNPLEQSGTYPLPESQLDRFLMRIQLGYPPPSAEKDLLKGVDRKRLIDQIDTVISSDQLITIQQEVENQKASDALIDYVMRIIQYTRESEDFHNGLSPRGGLALLKAGKAWAYLHHRDFVLPEDIQQVAGSVIPHRTGAGSLKSRKAVEKMLQTVEVC